MFSLFKNKREKESKRLQEQLEFIHTFEDVRSEHMKSDVEINAVKKPGAMVSKITIKGSASSIQIVLSELLACALNQNIIDEEDLKVINKTAIQTASNLKQIKEMKGN